jgi:hypothetical protein
MITATEKYRRINYRTSYGHSSEILAKIPRENERWLGEKWLCSCHNFPQRPSRWLAIYVAALASSRTQTVDVAFRSFFYFQESHSKGRNVVAFSRLLLAEEVQLTICALRITKGKFHLHDKYRAINRHRSSASHSFRIVKD